MSKQLKTKITHEDQIYPVILRRESEGGFVIFNPAFEECYSQGNTAEEALANYALKKLDIRL